MTTKVGQIVTPLAAAATAVARISPEKNKTAAASFATGSEDPADEQKTLERIRRYIDNPPETSKVFTIAPTIAEALLRDYNLENRPKNRRPSRVTRTTWLHNAGC